MLHSHSNSKVGGAGRGAPVWRGLALTAALLGSAEAQALALGEIEVQSYLNEPFVATVAAAISPGERLTRDCIRLTLPPGQDERDFGINYLRDATIEIDSRDGRSYLTLRSRSRVVDPVLGIVLRVDCEGSGAMLREYTALLDPRLPRSLQPAYARRVPAPPVPAPAPASGAGGSGEWRVRPGETLSRIAAQLAPGDRRAQARLVEAIVAANPAVFPDGDPNRLPAGALLSLPQSAPGAPAIARPGAPVRRPVPVSARAPDAVPPEEAPATAPRLSLTNSEQVTDLESANETARMVAESRRLLMETEAQYADTAALKARLQRLEKQIALLERALLLTERSNAVNHPAPEPAPLTPQPPEAERETPVALVVPPAAPARETPAVQIPAATAAAPQIEATPERRDYGWWVGGLLLLGVLLLFWRLRRRTEVESAEEPLEWPLDQLMPEPIGASAAGTAGGGLGGETPDLFHKETVFNSDPLAALPEQESGHEDTAALDPDRVPVLDHELTQRLEPQELMVETFDFEEHDTAAKPEMGNVLVRAEFHLLLRQAENAIRLLREAIEGDEPLNREPALWLMLLRVYLQEGMRESFEKLHAEFNRLFNIAVPVWDEAPRSAGEAALEDDYPRILNRIVQLWDSRSCEDFLNSLLRDDRDGTRRGFDLNIAEELLLLKGVWRVRQGL